jgi:transcriptional regulator
MHPNPRVGWDDRAAMRAFVREQSFGALFLATADGPLVAHVPTVWLGAARLGVHLSLSNALVPHLDGASPLFVVQGPHGYISPDWYGLDDQVPTWAYVTVELEGVARRMETDALLAQIDALSAEHEARLAPKPVWTRAKMTPGRAEKMATGIAGFTLDITRWRGTRKLGQPKPAGARTGSAEGLESAGSAELAALIRATIGAAES